MSHRAMQQLAIVAMAIGAHGAALSAQSDMPMNGMNMNRRIRLPAEEVQLLTRMSDANILGHLAATDSLEVAMSDTAIMQSRSDAVLGYAKMVRAAHLASMNAVKVIGHDTRITPTLIVGEMNRTHMYALADSVGNASNTTIDRHYIQQQIALHQHLLAELGTLESVARSPRVREHIAAEIPAVRNHLMRARAIAHEKGFESKRLMEDR